MKDKFPELLDRAINPKAKVLCCICEKRYVKQQEWKTPRQKQVCMSCEVVDTFLNQTLESIWHIAKARGLDFHFTTRLEPHKKFPKIIKKRKV